MAIERIGLHSAGCMSVRVCVRGAEWISLYKDSQMRVCVCACVSVVVWCCGGVALFMVFKIERNLLLTP